MKKSMLTMFLLTFTQFTSIACKKPADPNESELNYSVIPRNQAHLNDTFNYLKDSPQVKVCVGKVGYSGGESFSVGEINQMVKDSLYQWLKALDGAEYWDDGNSDTIIKKLVVTQKDSPCEGSFIEFTEGFSVNFFATQEHVESYFCKTMANNAIARVMHTCGQGKSYSIGDFTTRTIIMSPRLGFIPRPRADIPPTLTHEFGHVFGLFDTYKMPPRVDYEGIPAYAIMSKKSLTVQEDDISGIRAALKFAVTGSASCGEFTSQKNKGIYQDIIYCDISRVNNTPKDGD